MIEPVEIEKRGGQNDFWHVAERHEPEEGEGAYYHVINYARHERIYIHDATEARAKVLAEVLNKHAY